MPQPLVSMWPQVPGDTGFTLYTVQWKGAGETKESPMPGLSGVEGGGTRAWATETPNNATPS